MAVLEQFFGVPTVLARRAGVEASSRKCNTGDAGSTVPVGTISSPSRWLDATVGEVVFATDGEGVVR
jgi:hypothetical protein